jgi:hypothetical protein
MRFLVITKSIQSGVSYHRLYKPFEKLKEKGHLINIVIRYHENEINKLDYDYLVFNRGLGYSYRDIEIIDEFKGAGVKIIMDIDDYWELPDHHPITWRKDVDYDEWRGSIVANLALADYIWTSTEWLKSKINTLLPNTPTIVAKNAVDYYDEDQWSKVQSKSKHKNKVVVGYAGSSSHYKDLDILKNPIRRINSNKFLRNKTVFGLFGVDNVTEYGMKVWQNQIDIVTSMGLYGNFQLESGRSVYKYASFYDEMDISIASVIDNDFNRCKSELKIIEAGAKYKPFIGTNSITYSRTQANVDLCTSEDDWTESMKELILSKTLRTELGKELGEYVRDNYIIEKENETRLSIL